MGQLFFFHCMKLFDEMENESLGYNVFSTNGFVHVHLSELYFLIKASKVISYVF